MSSPLQGVRIGLVTASASRLGGGVFEAVVTHAAMLRELGAIPQVFALEDARTEEDRSRFGLTEVTACPVSGPRQVGYSPNLLPDLLRADLDCLHLHGIWMYPSAAASRWAARTRRPYFISPHGMLDPWITARGRAKKAVARVLYERTSWRRATALHALTPREATDIARESGRTDSRVVPNAGPLVKAAHPGTVPGPLLVYIGRIHAKKNLVALVQGWSAAQKPADARLVIAGWGDGAAVDDLKLAIAAADGTAEFIGPIFGEAKESLLDSARFIVLPSHSEGLPMAILEAWAKGVPTLMTEECNLAMGFEAGAALRCGYDGEAIAACLTQALDLDGPAWQRMSAAATKLASGPFSACTVASAWADIYLNALKDAALRSGNG